MKTKQVPLEAMRFNAPAPEVGEVSDDGSAPIKMVALSGEPLSHWYWGQIVQDLDGMQVGESISIDWCHDDNDVIGIGDEFNTDSGQLEISGQLIPFREGDRASEVIFRSRKGTPYEASIFFCESKPGDVKIEELGAGESATVNGRQVNGPITIFRQWPLRRVAVCPSGLDSGTMAVCQSNQNQKTMEIEVMEKPTDDKADAAPATVEQKTDPTPVEPKEIEQAVQDPRDLFKQYCDFFGDTQAAAYFKQGLSLDDAKDAHIAYQNAEIERLKTEQAAKPGTTGNAPADFDPAKDEEWTTEDESEWKKFRQSVPSADYETFKKGKLERKKQRSK